MEWQSLGLTANSTMEQKKKARYLVALQLLSFHLPAVKVIGVVLMQYNRNQLVLQKTITGTSHLHVVISKKHHIP